MTLQSNAMVYILDGDLDKEIIINIEKFVKQQQLEPLHVYLMKWLAYIMLNIKMFK